MNPEQKPGSPKNEKSGLNFENPLKAYRHAGPLFGTGIQLAGTVVILFFIGSWLDDQWHTTPWMMVIAISIGIVGGLIKFIRTVNEISKSEERERNESTSL
jgi:F0F1-type ATP synthase assembly protein I